MKLPKMRYRVFGRTGLAMPVFSSGGMRFQQSWKDEPLKDITSENQAKLEACIQRALELGISHIETARGYGSSEAQLGQILPQMPREQMIIQTKVGPSANPQDFVKGFETSMSRLQLDYVDLLSLHGLNNRETVEWSLRRGGCLEAARKFQREGRVRFIGFSTHAAPQLIHEVVATGEFDYVNLHWYFINQFAWQAIEEAARQNLGVFIISPSDKGGRLYDPPPRLVDLCRPLTPMQFNDLFCLSHAEVHTLSIGAARPSDYEEHIAALEYYDQLHDVVPPIAARIQGRLEEYHGREWMDRWWVGIPDYEELPGKIHVKEIVRLWTYATALDMTEFGRQRYNLLGKGGHWFPGQKAGQLVREEMRQHLKESRFAERILEVLEEAHSLFEGEEKRRLSDS